MNDYAIKVTDLGKRYYIGGPKPRYKTFRETLMEAAASPFRRARKLLHGHATGAAELDQAIWALKNVSFSIDEGEVVGIIGANGAGKSTLLKVLSRITEPTRGEARIRGRVGSLLEVGTGFHPELTGRENVFLNGAILGMRRHEIERKFDEIVAFAEVEKFIDTPVKHYSSGMQVRLAFAVAAHLDPEILLVDEVLAVGDVAFQRKCLGKMENVATGGRTVLFVSHNMAAVSNLCQRALLLRQGSLVAEGKTDRIIEEYLEGFSDLMEVNLEERKDRKGRGEIIVSAIEYLNEQDELIEYPICGHALKIRLHYQANSDRVFKNCRVSVSASKDERAYCLFSTELVDQRPLTLQGQGYVDFVVPQLPLSESVYTLDAFIGSSGYVQDWIRNAASLQVVDGDFYGTGRNYPEPSFRGKYVLVKFSWEASNGQASPVALPEEDVLSRAN